MDNEDEVDSITEKIILASSRHDVKGLHQLLHTGSANVQDPKTGITPLHAAIVACERINVPGELNSRPRSHQPELQDKKKFDILAAEETVKLLFQNGAIWNDLDMNNETPGCIAFRLGLENLYEMIVDAGARAELLLNRLDEYEMLVSDGDDSNLEDDDLSSINTPSNSDVSNIQTHISRESNPANDSYLSKKVVYEDDRLLDADQNGVMMSWESGIMQRTANILGAREGLTCLNIGHGMGIIDKLLQEKRPIIHHIVEAHPDVLQRMRQLGWYDRSNVVIHEGRWQDVLPKLVDNSTTFDSIYYDTFAEDYKAFKLFFSEYVIQLLNPAGKWSFFHGLGADRRVCYDVYTKVVEMDLFEAGFDVDWETVAIPELVNSLTWQGVQRRYWSLNEYKLPTCSFLN